MPSSGIEHLDLPVQRIPRVEPFSTVTPPTPLTVWRSKVLELIQSARVRDGFWWHKLCYLQRHDPLFAKAESLNLFRRYHESEEWVGVSSRSALKVLTRHVMRCAFRIRKQC